MLLFSRWDQRSIQIHRKSQQYYALLDLQTIFKIIGHKPIQCSQLVPGEPSYIGHMNSCVYGTGGIWLSGLKTLRPVVWRLAWPQDIIDRYHQKLITINDLEMAGLLLHYLLLEQLVDMKGIHAAAWCDNTSAVSWTSKMSSNKSIIGQQLTRALAIRMIQNQSSHLAALSIAGADNILADLASRSFKKTGIKGNYSLTDIEFLTKFNSDYPLQQGTSWLLLRLHTKIISNVFTILRGKTSSMASLIRLKKSGCDIGLTGSTSAKPYMVEWTRFLPKLKNTTKLTSCKDSPVMSVKGTQAEDIKCALARFRTLFAPSARSSKWHDCPTQPTNQQPTANNGTPSNK